MKLRLTIIGVDDNISPDLSAQAKRAIANGRVFSGGARHHKIVESFLPQGSVWIDIVPPMGSLVERYREHSEIVVFASGDPLFYGFAQTAQRLLPDAEIVTFPHFNSLQQLAHSVSMPYQEMHAVSLTGRAWDRFDEALICGYDMIGVLTDRRDHTPQKIAQRMVDYGYDNYQITVGELLGNETEKVTTMSLQEAVAADFAYPNNLILKRKKVRERHFGIADNLFELLDGRERMITKMPIRLTSLSQLNLHGARTLWDVGFCTGSVSIEAKLQFAHLRVEAFEIREGCDEIIEKNMRRFGAPGIRYHIGDFTELDLSALDVAPPDAVFIGGHGGKLDQIISKVVPLLSEGGAVVTNSVSQQSHDDFIAVAERYSLRVVNQIRMQVDEYNAITIIKAVK